jgi:aspartyl/glutamyl-tRNA(Asn/Gln) amidotransferase C subunit
MSKITPEEVKNLFALARLPMDEKVFAERSKDLEEILGYVASLSRLDTSSAKEVHGGTDFLNALREDVCVPSEQDIRDAVVRSFPTPEADMNKVPSILGK